jgi:hypothetical protein
MRRTDALGGDEHAPAFLGQPEGRREAGEAGADHDRVVGHVGKCWTRSRP